MTRSEPILFPLPVPFAASTRGLSRRELLRALACAALPVPAFAAAPHGAAGDAKGVLLASVDDGRVDPSPYLVSEKYDGVRALWDGRTLRFRSGRAIAAPAGFVAALPAVPLDGELWLGRGRFDALSGLVRRAEPHDAAWSQVRYMAFELPDAAGPFAARAAHLATLAAGAPGPLAAAPQQRIADRATLQRRLAAVVAGGGEGLMLHRADAPVATGRSDVLLKLKPFLDAEARVVGHRAGAGKYAGRVGALDVASADGRHFRVGSGLSDALRREPPPVGSVVTYRYRDLTPSGLPRFATFLRRYEAL